MLDISQKFLITAYNHLDAFYLSTNLAQAYSVKIRNTSYPSFIKLSRFQKIFDTINIFNLFFIIKESFITFAKNHPTKISAIVNHLTYMDTHYLEYAELIGHAYFFIILLGIFALCRLMIKIVNFINEKSQPKIKITSYEEKYSIKWSQPSPQIVTQALLLTHFFINLYLIIEFTSPIFFIINLLIHSYSLYESSKQFWVQYSNVSPSERKSEDPKISYNWAFSIFVPILPEAKNTSADKCNIGMEGNLEEPISILPEAKNTSADKCPICTGDNLEEPISLLHTDEKSGVHHNFHKTCIANMVNEAVIEKLNVTRPKIIKHIKDGYFDGFSLEFDKELSVSILCPLCKEDVSFSDLVQIEATGTVSNRTCTYSVPITYNLQSNVEN